MAATQALQRTTDTFLGRPHQRAPFVIGLVLGKIAEESLHKALGLWGMSFFTRPLSLVMLLMALAMVVIISLPAISKKREETFVED